MDGIRRLPIVKYDGKLWYFDARLNELRDIYTAAPMRLDSSELEKSFFETLIKEGKIIDVYDADKQDQEEMGACPINP